MGKVTTLNAAAKFTDQMKLSGKTVGLVVGSFDVVHLGHLNLFRFAKKYVDFLVVGLDNDKTISLVKGKGRPINNYKRRGQFLNDIETIDKIFEIKDTSHHDSEAKRSKYLILGSFVAIKNDESYDWYYGKKVNQFWPILENVYGEKLPDKKIRQRFFAKNKIAIADIIFQCERRENNSKDTSLVNCVYNKVKIGKILKNNPIEKIFFTSKHVEKAFRKHFKDFVEYYPQLKLIALPSPSPRYATITKTEKIRRYKKLLPRCKTAQSSKNAE